MSLFINFVLKYPKNLIFVLFVTTIILGQGILKLEFDNSIESFLPKDNEIYRLYNQSKEIYGDNGKFIVTAISGKNLWSPEFFEKNDLLHTFIEEYETFNADTEKMRLDRFNAILQKDEIYSFDLIAEFKDDPAFQALITRKLKKKAFENTLLKKKHLLQLNKKIEFTYQLKKSEPIDFILSPITAQDISGEDDSLETYSLIETDGDGNRILPRTPEELETFKSKLVRNPAYKNGIYATNKATNEITDFGMVIKFKNIKNQDPIARELLAIFETFQGLKAIPMGTPIGMIRFTNYMQRDLFTFLPIVTLVVSLIFFFNFRSFRGVMLPFLSVNMSQIWVLGLMGHLGVKITAVGISLPPLMCAVGSSYSIHILNQYYADFDLITRMGTKKGLKLSMSHISMTVLLAAVTTFVAFMTLAPTQISAISEWGIFSAVGVIFALFISATLIPACLSIMPHKMPRLLLKKNNAVKVTLIDRYISLITILATRHYKMVLSIVFILLSISVAGLSKLQVESDFMSYFKSDDPFRTNCRIVNEKFRGTTGFNILINSGQEDGINNPDFLKAVEEIRHFLTREGNEHLNIGRTDAFTDFIKTMHFAMNQDDMLYYKIPDNKFDILDYLELYGGDDENSDGRPDEFESYIDPSFSVCNIVARVCEKEGGKPVGTAKLERMVHDIETHLDKTLPEPYTYKITGFSVMDIVMSQLIVSGQIQSLILCLIVISIIVTFLFSNLKAGVLSLIPMSVAVTFNFGIMGLFGINLDMVTSIIAAITIGIGVDDTIHFLNTFKFYRESGNDIDTTIEKTLRVSGKAIIYTSLALILGFSVLMISNFNPIILFGALMALTMISTTIGALLILPAVIKATNVDLERSQSKFWKYLDLGKVFGLKRLEPHV